MRTNTGPCPRNVAPRGAPAVTPRGAPAVALRRVPAVALLGALLALAACDDPGPPAPTPDRIDTATHTVHEWPPPDASSTTTAEPAPTATASAEPTATASAAPSGEPAPSATASAAPVTKAFAFPSPKSGVLSPGEADKILKNGSHSKVRVLDAGKEPLAKLAYAATKGDTQPLRIDIEQKMVAIAQGQKTPITGPPQALDVDMATGDVDDTTGALVTLLLRGITLKPADGVDAEVLGELQKQLSTLSGYTLTERVSPSGEISSATTKLPPTAPKGAEAFLTAVNDVFRSMLPSFPEQPVGVGAKWQAISREDRGGASVVQLAEYTLKEQTGTKVTLGYSMRQIAAGDQIKLPVPVPEGTSTKITKFSSSVTGSLVVDTKEIGPVKGRWTQDTKVNLDMVRKDQPTLSAETTVKVTATFSRRGGAPAGGTTAAPSIAPSVAPTAAPSVTPTAAPAAPTAPAKP